MPETLLKNSASLDSATAVLPAIVWVHGVFGSPREFAQVTPVFEAQGFPCLAVTLPAHGPEPTHRFWELDDSQLVTHVSQQVDVWARETRRPVVLVGHSLGGILSLIVAGTQPEALCGVVSLAGAYDQAHLLTPNWHRMKIRQLWRSLRYIPDYWHGFEKPRLPLRHVPYFRRQGYALLGRVPAALEAIQVPVLLAHSPYDLSIPWEQHHRIYLGLRRAGVPVQSVELEACGHQIFPLSRAQEPVMRLIEAFVRQVSQAAVN